MTDYGVNYKSLLKVAQDIPYFKLIDKHFIRTHVPFAPTTWSPASHANWRAVAKQFYDAGFHVMWGYSSFGYTTPITSSNWPNYAASVISEAAYCEANNICHMFIIANELEQFNDNTTLTDAQLRTNLRALATEVKAVFSGDVIYCSEYGSSASTFGTYRWIQEGKGDLDYLGANLYGNYDLNTQVYFPRYAVGQGGIPALNAAFGSGPTSQWILSEFGVDGTAEVFNAMPKVKKEMELRKYMKFISDNNVKRAYLYQYRAYNDVDATDSFYQRYSDDSFSTAWNSLLSHTGRQYYA